MADGKLAGKNVLIAIPHTQFRDEEFFEPKKILEGEGATVTVASTAVRMCYGTQGGSVQSTVTIADSKAENYDALVICGGPSVPDLFWNDKKLGELAAAMSAAGKVVAAISLSTVVLAKAKLLAGKQATVYFLPQALQELRTAGATYVSDPLIVQEKIILAEGPTESARFGQAISAALQF
ncbi:MAG TPA: DJ-1/PfpI family protein [Terriglobia bacterium]|nr:DJ-1/PfpI family protein [Terriglobia bacterium]